ncbi:hypothetical protein CN032_24365 [Salmonella enterica subsp. enterica serovar Newport]|nr:hypothetical protein [Salmonella enterica subsp. enterica serovar Newport]
MMKNLTLIHACSLGPGLQGLASVRDNDFVGLPLLIFTFGFIPPVFIGIHYPILILMNVVLLTERSDRCRQTLRSENVLSVFGMVRIAVTGPTPFSPFFAVFYTTRNA